MGKSQFIIDDGLHEVVFKNNAGEEFCKFSFNPSDSGLVPRIESFIDFIENSTLDEEGDTIQQIIELDEKIKQQFDIALNREVSKDAFAVYNPCTVFANGKMFIEYIVEKLGDVIESETDKRLKKKYAKIKKATEKNRV